MVPGGSWHGEQRALGPACGGAVGGARPGKTALAAEWSVGLRIVLAVPAGLALLLSIGTAQWTVLRPLVRGAARWIAWTALAWPAGLAVFMAVATPLWQPGQAPWLSAVIGAGAGADRPGRTGRRTGPSALS
jgi:hypothetical protein